MFLRSRMNRAYLILAVVLWSSFPVAGELDENNGPNEYIHQVLHRAVEVYLVRYDAVVKSARAYGTGDDRIDVSATIIEGIKGKRSTGDRIEFFRVLDGRYKDTNKFVGQLYIVFYEETENGAVINPQDPSAVTMHSIEKLQYLQNHKKKHNK